MPQYIESTNINYEIPKPKMKTAATNDDPVILRCVADVPQCIHQNIESSREQKICSISASNIQIFKLYLILIIRTHGSWSAAGQGGMHHSAQYSPTSWSGSRQSLTWVIPATCIVYTRTGVTLTHDPPPSFWKKLGRREGANDLLRHCHKIVNKIIFKLTKTEFYLFKLYIL